MRLSSGPALFLLLGLGILTSGQLVAAPIRFDLPAQPAAEALQAFARQTKLEVLFSYDELSQVQANAVTGSYEPSDALNQLLQGTAFAARRSTRGKFVITAVPRATGTIRGRLLRPDGTPAWGITVQVAGTAMKAMTGEAGNFALTAVPPGTWRLLVTPPGLRPMEFVEVRVEAWRTLVLEPQRLLVADEITRLEPFVVRAESNSLRTDREAALVARRAAGNLDLPRTQDDALPYAVFTRDQIARSGVVNLNEFLQREVLDSDAATSSAEQTASPSNSDLYINGSSNLKLRGFESDETVILVNGRRLPETLQQETGFLGPPDVNFIPLSLIQQVEVLPVSASALYNGNAVGGVINIVLRPAVDTTEVTLTYTNALRGFDAPQSSLSLQHGRTLLGGRLRLRLNATWFKRTPPVETELGFRQGRTAVDPGVLPHRATPNVRSASGDPLFGPGSPNFTSVAPGTIGTATLADFAGRAGVQNLDLFDSPGGAATSPDSIDYAYGRRQQRATYFGSVVYDVRPWLELGLDGLTSRTVVNRGDNIFAADLTVPATSAFNPFRQELQVALNDTPVLLGQQYSEAHLQMSAVVFGALVKFPRDWRLNLDAQYSRSTADYRGFAGIDPGRWQELVEQGKYNPLRDTQRAGPPREFYDRVLVFNGGRDRFVTFSDYDTLDAALRVTNQTLALPTGRGAVNVGGDYRRNHLAPFTDVRRYGDDTLAGPPQVWTGRTLERYSVFGELQAPVLAPRLRPDWLHNLDADLAVRYVAADTSKETNVAPTIALKADFAGGWALRGSFTTSNRFPTPHMSERFVAPGLPGGGDETTYVYDPRRDENYNVSTALPQNANLDIEAAATQTAGIIFQRGKVHRWRAALDFVDTRKTNELLYLDAQAAINVEDIYPGRVVRQPPNPSEAGRPGRITNVFTGSVNAASRHSQNLNLSADYQWKTGLGGTLNLYGRWVYIARYDRQLLPGSPTVDEVAHPDGTTSSLLRHRVNLGAGWTTSRVGFGLDGHYYGARILPETEWASQGSEQINPYWQFDGYLQSDLHRWLPWKGDRVGLRAQLRVNNLFYSGFPKYANDGSGAGVQPYGDWRGRTYSLSLTATF